MSCGVGCRHSADPPWLWLWYRAAAAAPVQPLAWEPPYAMGAALKKKKKMMVSCCIIYLINKRADILCQYESNDI